MRATDLKGKTIVITGASSGIGLATAQELARQGAHLVLASRRGPVLETVARACEALGGRAFAVETDVTDRDAVERLADAAIARYGRIDVWINNAGAGAIGAFDEVPVEVHEQVVRLNLLGYLYGAHAAVRRFKAQGHGTLINNISVGAWVPLPYAVAYSATKFGLHGMTRALRGELADVPGVHVCSVYATVVDTPAFERAANYTGHRIAAKGPTLDPKRVAKVIAGVAKRPRAETMIGATAPLARVVEALAPHVATLAAAFLFRKALAHAPRAPRSDGQMLRPSSPVARASVQRPAVAYSS